MKSLNPPGGKRNPIYEAALPETKEKLPVTSLTNTCSQSRRPILLNVTLFAFGR